MQPASPFEPLPSARHRVEVIEGVEWIVIRAGRNWVAIAFLAFWLFFWTIGGGVAIIQVLSPLGGVDRAFLMLWLVGWAVGWAFAASWLFWQLAGRHMVAVHGGALIYRWQMPLRSRTKRYEAAQVRNLSSMESGWSRLFGGGLRQEAPPFAPMQGGTIKFDYGARTIRLIPGLDESEGRMIVERLMPKLPRGAAQ